METEQIDESQLPFVAPCRVLPLTAPLGWLRLGFADYCRACLQSVSYGLVMAAIFALVGFCAWVYGSYWLVFAVLGGFVFLAPLTCIGLYAVSAQLERGQPVSLKRAVRASFRRYIGNEMIFALILMIIFLVWARAAAMVGVFFPVRGQPEFSDFFVYLSVGSAVGALFAGVTFSVSAFSLPMIMHRRVDAVTAVVTSINAVLRNKRAMVLWLALIMLGIVIGIATAFLGLILILPVIGYAVWHGYLDTIDASEFPRHEVGITATPRLQS